MADIYKNYDRTRCKASVYESGGWHLHQCLKKPWKDGWCKIHHPESEKKREETKQKRHEKQQANSPLTKLIAMLEQKDKLREALKFYLALHNDKRGGMHRTEKQWEVCRQFTLKTLTETE